MVGQVIGHYYLEAKIGEGQFGVVYKSQDIRLKRTVALKVLKEKYLQGNSAWGRLLREAQVVSVLNHPNICTLYDIGEEQDINYIVLEFVEGRSLRAILEQGPLPIGYTLNFAMQIAEAMAYIHCAGILHLDLKSSNIMVTPNDRIKIVDFGLAKLMEQEKAKREKGSYSSAQEIGWAVGTLPYMAPELLHGEEATTQSGVWSLGVILFEMLTGRLPFSGRSPFELGMNIMTGTMEDLSMDIPASVQSIVRRCLERDKERRSDSVAAVLNYLQSEFIIYQIRTILASRPPSHDHRYSVKWLGSVIWWVLSVLLAH